MAKKKVKVKTFKVMKGDIAYYIIEELEKRKTDFSSLMRRLIVTEFSNKTEFKQAKINRLLNERKMIKKEVPKISKQLEENEKELNRLGHKI
jgi:hypothetical protein